MRSLSGSMEVMQDEVKCCRINELIVFCSGPGCSSLEGFLQENGLIRWTWGQYAPTINDYSWVNLTNVLWVEQPVGTGFSKGKVNATNEVDIATDFIHFFKNFQVSDCRAWIIPTVLVDVLTLLDRPNSESRTTRSS